MAVGSEADQLAAIAAAPHRFLIGNLLTFLGTALIGAGLICLAHRLRHRQRGAVDLTAVAAPGWLLHTCLIAHNTVSYELAKVSDRAAPTALAEQLNAGPVFLGLLIPMLLATVLGTIGAAVAWWRAGQAPIWGEWPRHPCRSE